jgi:hypothetical protein
MEVSSRLRYVEAAVRAETDSSARIDSWEAYLEIEMFKAVTCTNIPRPSPRERAIAKTWQAMLAYV